jgi:hypothetical protein
MVAAFYLLLVIGHIGLFDVLYFHYYRCRLHARPECHREVFWHTIRHSIYGLQFLIISNLRFHGLALLLLAAIYTADVFIAWSDVWEETLSRRNQGGLPRAEYFMHIVLSLLVGAYILLVGQNVWPDRLLRAGVVVDPPAVPGLLRLYMSAMGAMAFVAFTHDLLAWLQMHKQLPVKTVAAGRP